MNKYNLAVLIPARNEMFLSKTVQNLLENKGDQTEIIVGLDGQFADPLIDDHPDLTLFYVPQSIGQRAMTNQLARLTKAKYVMKLDAHCLVDKDFDSKLIADMQDNWTMIPMLYNLHGFDWVCIGQNKRSGRPYQEEDWFADKPGCIDLSTKKVTRLYQSPTQKCPNCKGNMERQSIFKPRFNRKSTHYQFDKEMHFQYWNDLRKRPGFDGDISESLSAQGSCFMLTREKYWSLGICDEGHGSWGQQGTEVACKTWLSGGRLVINRKTWYSHMFRTQGGDFGFPYPLSGSDQDKSKRYSRDLWLNDKWPLAIHKLQWLLDKFAPIPKWHAIKDADKKGIIYYTDNRLNLKIAHAVQNQLRKIGLPITSSSLKPMTNMGKNIYLPLQRGYETYFKQIIAALEASTAEIVFFCEADNLMHSSHFEFTPPDKHTFYYDLAWWKIRKDGFAAHWDANQVSGLCCYREHALEWYRNKLKTFYEQVKATGKFDRKFEPNDNEKTENWKAPFPSIDIRHDHNLTYNKWSLADFRDKSTAANFEESTIDKIPGWDAETLRNLF